MSNWHSQRPDDGEGLCGIRCLFGEPTCALPHITFCSFSFLLLKAARMEHLLHWIRPNNDIQNAVSVVILKTFSFGTIIFQFYWHVIVAVVCACVRATSDNTHNYWDDVIRGCGRRWQVSFMWNGNGLTPFDADHGILDCLLPVVARCIPHLVFYSISSHFSFIEHENGTQRVSV